MLGASLRRHACKDSLALLRLACNEALLAPKGFSANVSTIECGAAGFSAAPWQQWAAPSTTACLASSLRHFSSGRPLLSPPDNSRLPPPAPQQTAGWTVQEVVNLPNSLSMLRLLSGPVIAAWIIEAQWSIAIPALAVSGATDWLDGYFARRNGNSNVLGSYLDPLADKVLIASVVGALGYTGALPAPLVGIVLARDALLLFGAFALRAHSLGWRWPGLREFFRIVPLSAAAGVTESENPDKNNNQFAAAASHSNSTHVAPVVQPLLISKVNTALQLGLVGACMTDAWLGWPGSETVWGLGAVTAGTTVLSLAAYVRAFLRKELPMM